MFKTHKNFRLIFLVTLALILVAIIMLSLFRSRTNSLQDLDFNSLNYPQKLSELKKISLNDPQKAWNLLKKTYTQNNQTIDDVHSFAHVVGNQAYLKLGVEAVKICDATFSYGCFHGVTESMLLTESKDVLPLIEKSCIESFTNNPDFLSGCIHGTGHGLFAANSNDLNKSLDDCQKFQENNREFCYDGVFMEYSENPPTASSNAQNFSDVCSGLNREFLLSCSRFIVQILGRLNNWDTKLIIDGCNKIKQNIVSDECFIGVGYYTVFQSKANFDGIISTCSVITNQFNYSSCIIGAVRQTVSQKYVDYQTIAQKLCATTKVNTQKCQKEIENF